MHYKRIIYNLINERDSLIRKIDEIKLHINKEVERDRKIYELNLNLQNAYKVINELENKLRYDEKQIEKLKEVLYNLLNGKVIVVKRNSKVNDITFDGNNIYIGKEKVNNEIAEYVDKEIIILDKQLLNDLEVLRKELQIERSKDIDIKRIIDEYRNRRLKESSFSF